MATSGGFSSIVPPSPAAIAFHTRLPDRIVGGIARRGACANPLVMTSTEMLESAFATLPDLVRAHAAERPEDIAAADPARRLSWSELDATIDRIAVRLQAVGLVKGDRTAIAGLNSVEQMAVILGTLTAGPAAAPAAAAPVDPFGVASPLAPSTLLLADR